MLAHMECCYDAQSMQFDVEIASQYTSHYTMVTNLNIILLCASQHQIQKIQYFLPDETRQAIKIFKVSVIITRDVLWRCANKFALFAQSVQQIAQRRKRCAV